MRRPIHLRTECGRKQLSLGAANSATRILLILQVLKNGLSYANSTDWPTTISTKLLRLHSRVQDNCIGSFSKIVAPSSQPSAFLHPSQQLARRHGPRGYAVSRSYRPWLRDEFSFRCVYCQIREQWGRLTGEFDLDHFLPQRHNTDRA